MLAALAGVAQDPYPSLPLNQYRTWGTAPGGGGGGGSDELSARSKAVL